MTSGDWIAVVAIVVPIVATIIGDGARTRSRIAVLETLVAVLRKDLQEHEDNALVHRGPHHRARG